MGWAIVRANFIQHTKLTYEFAAKIIGCICEMTSSELNVRVGVRYVVPKTSSIKALLQSFQHPSWVRFVLQTLGPKLQNAAPAMPGFLDDLDTLSDDTNNCPVCLTDAGMQVQLPCGHQFHKDCAQTWFQSRSTCPVCRYQLPTLLGTGRHGVCSMMSALVLPKDAEGKTQEEILETDIAEGQTVRVVVQAQLEHLEGEDTHETKTCIVNAAWINTESSRSRQETMDTSPTAASGSVKAQKRKREEADTEKQSRQRLE